MINIKLSFIVIVVVTSFLFQGCSSTKELREFPVHKVEPDALFLVVAAPASGPWNYGAFTNPTPAHLDIIIDGKSRKTVKIKDQVPFWDKTDDIRSDNFHKYFYYGGHGTGSFDIGELYKYSNSFPLTPGRHSLKFRFYAEEGYYNDVTPELLFDIEKDKTTLIRSVLIWTVENWFVSKKPGIGIFPRLNNKISQAWQYFPGQRIAEYKLNREYGRAMEKYYIMFSQANVENAIAHNGARATLVEHLKLYPFLLHPKPVILDTKDLVFPEDLYNCRIPADKLFVTLKEEEEK